MVDKNFFVFSFKHDVDVRRAWDRRAWLIKGEHLILKCFSPKHNTIEVDFSTSEFWIQVYDLPLDKQSNENFLKIGSTARHALETDFIGLTTRVLRKNIRVRVEVDVSCPLIPGFSLEREHLPDLWTPFKYEKLGNFCFGCGILGHDQRDCQDKGVQLLQKEGVNFGFFGRWLHADNDEFQPGLKLEAFSNKGLVMKEDNNQVEKKHFSTVGCYSKIVRSWNAMDERVKQGIRDLSVKVLEACSRLIDGTKIENATTHLSKATRNLETHASLVTYQPNRPSSNTPLNQTPWMGPKSKLAQCPTHIITKDPAFTPIRSNTKSLPFNPKSPPMDPKSTLQAHPQPYIKECK